MKIGVLIAAFLSVFCCITAARSELSNAIEVTIVNMTPDFSLSPTIEVFGAAPLPFLATGDSKFVYHIPDNRDDWYIDANIRITWKNVRLSNEGKKLDFDQRIELRFGRLSGRKFLFPVYYSDDRTNVEMTRLEGLSNDADQFEKFFRGVQIAKFYRNASGIDHRLTRRAAKIAFFASKALAEKPRSNVVMSVDAERYVLDAVSETGEYKRQASEARSMYWFDLIEVNDMIEKKDCENAVALMKTFQEKFVIDQALYTRRYLTSPDFFSKKKQLVEETCTTQARLK